MTARPPWSGRPARRAEVAGQGRAVSRTASAMSFFLDRSSSRSTGPTMPMTPAAMPSWEMTGARVSRVAESGLLVLDRVA